MARKILLTGASGLVGGTLLRTLLDDPDVAVTCLVRAKDDADLQRRRDGLLARLDLQEEAARVDVVAGDMEAPSMGLGEDPAATLGGITEIIHCAASTRFDLDLERARAVNVDSVHRVIDLARAFGDDLTGLHYVSTAYCVGETDHPVVGPDDQPSGQWRNTYEQSKWESEEALAAADLPTVVYRPSIVVGDSKTGWTPHFRVLYEPMKWVAHGVGGDDAKAASGNGQATRPRGPAIEVVPCDPTVRIDVVPVDFVASAIAAIAADPPDGGPWLLTAGPDHSITIGQLADMSLEIGNARAVQLGRDPVELPRFVAPEELPDDPFTTLVAEVMRHHAPYMLKEQVFWDGACAELLASRGVVCPKPQDYWRIIMDFAVSRDYGRIKDAASR